MAEVTSPGGEGATDSIILEEEIDPNYVPSEEEVIEYAKWLGMDLATDPDLVWIAREGLMAPLPKNWKPCKTKDTGDLYYFNFLTAESTWDHPCDGYYKRLYEEEKKKKEIAIKESNDQKRTKARQDVEQLLGKGAAVDKKKPKALGSTAAPKKISSRSNSTGGLSEEKKLGPIVTPLPSSGGIEKKPLPDIAPKKSLIDPVLPIGGASLTQSKSVYDSKVADDDSDDEEEEPPRSLLTSNKKTRSNSASRLSSKLKSALSDSEDRESSASESRAMLSKSHDSSLSKVAAKESQSKLVSEKVSPRKSPEGELSASLEKSYTAKIAELEHEKMMAQEKTTAMEKELADLRGQVTFLRKDVVKKDDDLKSLQLNYDRLNAELMDSNQQLRARNVQVEELRKDMQTSDGQLNKELMAIRRELSSAKEDLSARDEEVRKLTDRLKNQTSESDTMLSAELTRQKSVVSNLQKTCDELREENRRLMSVEKDLDRVRRELDISTSNLSLQEAEVEKLRERLHSQLQEPADSEGKKQLQLLKDELLARNTELSRQKSLVSDLQRTCDELRDENKRLSNDIQKAKIESERSSNSPTQSERIAEIASLQREVARLTALNRDLESSLDRSKTDLTSLRNEVRKAEDNFANADKELMKSRRELDAAKYDLSLREAEVEKLRDRLHSQLQEPVDSEGQEQLQHLKDELLARNTELSRQKSLVSNLQRICDELREENRRISDKTNASSSASPVYTDRIAELQREVAELSSQKTDLETTVDRTKAEVRSLRNELHNAEELYTTSNKELMKSRRELDEAKYDLSLREAEVEKLRERLHSQLQEPVDSEGQEQLQHLKDELLARNTELSRQKSLVSNLQRICDELREENRRLSDDMQNMKHQLATLEELPVAPNRDSDRAPEIASLQREVARLTALTNERDALDASLNRSKTDMNHLRSELVKAEDRYTAADKELNRTRRDLDAAKFDLSERELEIERLRQRLHNQLEIDMEAKQQAQQLKEELNLRLSDVNRLQTMVDKLEQTCERLRDEINSRPMTDAVAELEAKVSKYKQQLIHMEEDNENTSRTLKLQRDEVASLRAENGDLQSKLHIEMKKAHDVALLLAALKNDKDSLDIVMNRLKSDNSSLRDEIQELEARSVVADRELARSRRELDIAKNDLSLRETEIDALRERLRNQLHEPADAEGQQQLQHLKDELLARNTELSRQKSLVSDLQRACDELREENIRNSVAVKELASARRELEAAKYDLSLREAEVEKLRERLHSQLQEPANFEGQEQLHHLKDELLARNTELSRQKSLVSNLQRTCDELREENRRLSDDIQRVKAQLSSTITSESLSRQQSGSPSLKNVVAGHEAQIMNLVAHRAALENVVTEQQSAVRKLEGKLSETEGLLRDVIKASSKHTATEKKSIHGTYEKPTQTDVHAHSSSDEIYRPTSERRPASADTKKHLSPDVSRRSKRHSDRTSRHKHHGGWMSDNDDNLSDSDSCPSSESVLRRVIADLVSKEYPSRKASHRSKDTFHADNTTAWKNKLFKEQQLLDDVRRALKSEKSYVRHKQSVLTSRREKWRAERSSSSPEQQQQEGLRLNRQTEQLNALVEQVRNTQAWLEEREAKLQQWERMMTRAEALAAEARNKRYEDESLALHLETMQKFEAELDQDVTLLDMDMHMTPQNRPHNRPSHTRISDTSPPHHRSRNQRSSTVTFDLPGRQLSQESASSGSSGALSRAPDSKAYAARVVKSSQAVGVAPPTPPEKSYATRDFNPAYNVKRLVEERKRSSEACEQHVSWLDNMRREISQFSLGAQPASSDGAFRGIQSSIAEMLSSSDFTSRSDAAVGHRASQSNGTVYRL